jgi:hypothetical protein
VSITLYAYRIQVNALSTGLLAHLVLAEMAKTADAPKARFKPHLVFVSSTGHYGAKFAQQDAEKILPAINDISTYSSNSFIRRMELYNLSKCKKRGLSEYPHVLYATLALTRLSHSASARRSDRKGTSYTSSGLECGCQ